MDTTQITQQQVAGIYKSQTREILSELAPEAEDRDHSDRQRTYAKGLARRRTLQIIDEACQSFARRHDCVPVG